MRDEQPFVVVIVYKPAVQSVTWDSGQGWSRTGIDSTDF